MDISSLAMSVVGIVGPHLAKLLGLSAAASAKEIGKSLGSVAWDHACSLWSIFGDKVREPVMDAAKALDVGPDDKAMEGFLFTSLKRHLEDDPGLVAELTQALSAAETSGIQIDVSGDRAAGAQNIDGSVVITGDSNNVR